MPIKWSPGCQCCDEHGPPCPTEELREEGQWISDWGPPLAGTSDDIIPANTDVSVTRSFPNGSWGVGFSIKLAGEYIDGNFNVSMGAKWSDGFMRAVIIEDPFVGGPALFVNGPTGCEHLPVDFESPFSILFLHEAIFDGDGNFVETHQAVEIYQAGFLTGRHCVITNTMSTLANIQIKAGDRSITMGAVTGSMGGADHPTCGSVPCIGTPVCPPPEEYKVITSCRTVISGFSPFMVEYTHYRRGQVVDVNIGCEKYHRGIVNHDEINGTHVHRLHVLSGGSWIPLSALDEATAVAWAVNRDPCKPPAIMQDPPFVPGSPLLGSLTWRIDESIFQDLGWSYQFTPTILGPGPSCGNPISQNGNDASFAEIFVPGAGVGPPAQEDLLCGLLPRGGGAYPTTTTWGIGAPVNYQLFHGCEPIERTAKLHIPKNAAVQCDASNQEWPFPCENSCVFTWTSETAEGWGREVISATEGMIETLATWESL